MKNDIQIEQQLAYMFPYPPYSSQLQLSVDLYNNLQTDNQNKVLIIQSPTGTGKTYALLTATLKWLKQHPNDLQQQPKNKPPKIQQNSNNSSSGSYPNWLPKANQLKKKSLIQKKQGKMKKMKTLAQYKSQKNRPNNKVKKQAQNNSIIQPNRENYEEQVDFQEQFNFNGKRAINNPRVTLLIQQEQQPCLPKIIFTSRTHSQLTQVINSLNQISNEFKAVILASKDHLCVNPTIQKTKVHEKCQYLLSHGGCQFYHHEEIQDFMNVSVEQAKKLGEINKICSYYGVKNMGDIADVLCVPYISILNPEIRRKLNINLNNSILIFDEAHNLIQQQLNTKSHELSYSSLQQLQKKLKLYLQKYGSKMALNNKQIIQHLNQIVTKFLQTLENEYNQLNLTLQPKNIQYIKMSQLQFRMKLNLMEIKLYKIKYYIAASNFDQKLAHMGIGETMSGGDYLNAFVDFLGELVTFQMEGKDQLEGQVVIIKNIRNRGQVEMGKYMRENVSVKILCLESPELGNIFRKSRRSILAGGTMQPIQAITSILKQSNLSYKYLRYPHIIQKNQCIVHPISKNPTNPQIQLKFTHKQINNKEKYKQILQNTKAIILRIIKKVQNNSGTVIFIQNYQIIGDIRAMLGEEVQGRRVFYDRRDKKDGKDNIFVEYQKEILEVGRSAVLVSVMGGKLSEGINFSDNLARALIVLGLPYPNLKSPQITQKMNFLNKKYNLMNKINETKGFIQSSKLKQEEDQMESGQQYYQNCCIKTLNQTIGRGIRHKKDYANIYLIDSRFKQMCYKLSKWLVQCVKFQQI